MKKKFLKLWLSVKQYIARIILRFRYPNVKFERGYSYKRLTSIYPKAISIQRMLLETEGWRFMTTGINHIGTYYSLYKKKKNYENI